MLRYPCPRIVSPESRAAELCAQGSGCAKGAGGDAFAANLVEAIDVGAFQGPLQIPSWCPYVPRVLKGTAILRNLDLHFLCGSFTVYVSAA